jgi:hypothetical protein
MSENSEDIKKIGKIISLPAYLIAASIIIYILGNYINNIKLLGLILAIASVLTFIICLFLLLKRRKESGTKRSLIQMTTSYFVMVLLLVTYLSMH